MLCLDAEIGVYPNFPNKAAALMKHTMELTIQATEYLNPGQISIVGADLIKLIQWHYPDTLGENKLVVMMVALHIEDKNASHDGKASVRL